MILLVNGEPFGSERVNTIAIIWMSWTENPAQNLYLTEGLTTKTKKHKRLLQGCGENLSINVNWSITFLFCMWHFSLNLYQLNYIILCYYSTNRRRPSSVKVRWSLAGFVFSSEFNSTILYQNHCVNSQRLLPSIWVSKLCCVEPLVPNMVPQ